MYMAGLAVAKKVEYIHYKTNNGEIDFCSLEWEWQLPVVNILNQELG